MTRDAPGRTALIREIALGSTLRGEFKLRSGATSPTYFDKYLFEADPRILRPLAKLMTSLLPDGTEILAGLELGGIPIATAMSLHTGRPVVFVRKQAKTYGTGKVIEGPDVTGKCVVVIEDVVSTGGAILESVAKLRDAGAVVQTVVCAIWRGVDLSPLHGADLDLRWAMERSELEAAME